MNRIVMMMLKNLHVVPAAFAKLWRYAADPEKYDYQEKWDVIHYIMERALNSCN